MRYLAFSLLVLLGIGLVVLVPQSFAAVDPCNTDINLDGNVNVSDYNLLVRDFLQSVFNNPRSDITRDGAVNVSDYNALAAHFLRLLSCQASPTPVASSTPAPVVSGEWTQFGHNAQHTSYTATGVNTPWKYKWQWNGAGADGKKQAGHLSAPDMVQPVTGDGRVYMIAGNQVFALSKANGAVLWSRGSLGTLRGTPAYDNGHLFVPSSDGKIYKLQATTGSIVSTFTGSSSFDLSVTIANGRLYAVSGAGILYAIDPTSLAKIWEYAGGAVGSTPVSFSPSKNTLLYLTQDLYVHAVDATTGLRKWRTKPTPRTYQSGDPSSNGAQAEKGWPVIAEQHGIVFVRYRLDWDTLWTWNPFPDSLSAIRTNLTGRADQQALFALRLDSGATAFVPLAGNGGAGDGGYLPMGTQPVIRTVGSKEVAYIIWRNKQTCAQAGWCDGREDATMGEMVLDDTTIPGYQAGDIRFVRNPDIQTDEMMYIAMANDTLFHSHWLINSAVKITDRSDSVGSTFSNPIKTTDAPYVIWRQCNGTNTCNYPGCTGNTFCGINCAVSTSRYCSQGLYSYGDARSYPAGFYQYNNDMSSGTTPFTVISDGMVLVKTNDGAILALESGSPTAAAIPETLRSQTQTSSSNVLGTQNPQTISHTQALSYMGKEVVVEGVIQSAEDKLPKAIYLGFTNPHDGHLLLRIFAKDVSKFDVDLLTLKGKKIRVTGLITAYWPEGKDPEIIVTDPSQIEVVE